MPIRRWRAALEIMDDAELNDGLSPDDVFEILSNARRRSMIHFLHEQRGQASLSDIADHIAAWEYDTSGDQVNSDQRRRVYISLYQTHLPKLAEYGVVDYDEDEKTVELTRRVRDVDRFLYIDDQPASRWWLAYVTLAIGAAALLVGTWLDGSLNSILPAEQLALLIAGAFIVLSASHYVAVRFSRRRRTVGREW